MKNQVEVDGYNSRIIAYVRDASSAVLDRLAKLQQQHNTTKTIVYTTDACRERFENDGFVKEGLIDKFFNGQDALILSRFFDEKRRQSTDHGQKDDWIRELPDDSSREGPPPLEHAVHLRSASRADAKQLARLYQRVFPYYPTPVFDPRYLNESIGDNYVFVVAQIGEDIVSAASATIKPEYGCAEITDCATLPEYRGRNFTWHIIREIEKVLAKRHIYCLFSLTRALSAGMNITVKRLGYTYRGRLVNNCIIYSGLEDMNIWTKYLK